MKKVIIMFCLCTLISCCNENEAIETEKMEFKNLGLSMENEYPYFPSTYRFLADNRWYHNTKGDTLVIFRRDMVTDDSGDDITYTFLKKPNNILIPLKVRRDGSDLYIIPVRSGIIFNKTISNCKFQAYIEDKILACEITTEKGDYYQNYTLVDRMWVNLSN